GGVVAGQVDAGDERDVHARGSGRGITRPARVGRDDVDDAGREGGDRRVLERERRPEETVLDGLAGAGGAAAIRVRGVGRLRGIRVDAVLRRRARPLGAIELAGPIAGDERDAGADVEVGGGSGRGGAGRDRAGTAAADVQTGGAKVEGLRRAGDIGVDLARERRARGAREARPAAGRRAGGRRVLGRQRARGRGGRRARRRGGRRGRRRGGAAAASTAAGAARIAAARHRPDARRPATRRVAGRRAALDRAARVAIAIGAAAGHEARLAAGRLRLAAYHGARALGPQRFVLDCLLRHHLHAVQVVVVAG